MNEPSEIGIADAAASTKASTPTNKVSAEALDRALGYPYARPPSSFVWSWHGSDGDGDGGESNSESESESSQHGSVHCFDDRAWARFFVAGGGEGGSSTAERLAEELRLGLFFFKKKRR